MPRYGSAEQDIDAFADAHADMGMQRRQDLIQTLKINYTAIGSDEEIVTLTCRYMLSQGVREYALKRRIYQGRPALTLFHNDRPEAWRLAYTTLWARRETELGDSTLVTLADLEAIHRQVTVDLAVSGTANV